MSMHRNSYMQPAADVIEAIGASRLQEELALTYTTIHRWRLPKEKSGTGGTIPFKYHSAIVALGVRIQRPISREMLMPEMDGVAA